MIVFLGYSMVYSTPVIFLTSSFKGWGSLVFEANGLSLITWKNENLFSLSLAYLMKETIFYSVIDYKQEEPKIVTGKATKSINLTMSHVPQNTYSKLLFAYRTKFEPFISKYKAFQKRASTLLPHCLPPAYTNSAFQIHQENHVHLKTPYVPHLHAFPPAVSTTETACPALVPGS